MGSLLNKIIQGDCLEVMKTMADSSINLAIIDPPYQEGFESIFGELKRLVGENGQILWFMQPTELFNMPEKPHQILVWEEPISPKPIYKKYREFLDLIGWYAYGDYTFNKQMWNLMNSRFNDEIIRDKRLHKWEKPETLIEKLIRVHTNEGDIILDPFLGSGTTALVASQLNRNYVGIELDPNYVKIAKDRLNQGELL